MVVYKRIRKSCLMFEFCLRNQKKKKQRILFSGFGFVSLFTNFIFAHTHTHIHIHIHEYIFCYYWHYHIKIFLFQISLFVLFIGRLRLHNRYYIYISIFSFLVLLTFSNYYYYRLCLILLCYKIYKVLGLETYIQIFPWRAILFFVDGLASSFFLVSRQMSVKIGFL